MKKQKLDVKTMTAIALMTAVTCIFGPMSLPIGPVPISLTVLAVYLGVFILGMWKGTLAYCIYLLIGLIGIPVFSGYTGGPQKLFGPTGGYLLGFIPMAIISGFFIDKFWKQAAMQVSGMVLGLVICYAIGTLWLAVSAHMDMHAALMAGVIPFIPFDLLKIAAALIIGRTVRPRLHQILTPTAITTTKA